MSQFFLLTHSLDLLSVLRIVGMWVSKKCISVRNAVTPARMNPALTLTPHAWWLITRSSAGVTGDWMFVNCSYLYYSATTTTTRTTTTTTTTTTALTATTTCRTHCDKRKRCSTRRKCDKIRRCEKRHHCEYECIAFVLCSSKNCHYIYDKNCRMITANCRNEKYNCKYEEYNCKPICGTG